MRGGSRKSPGQQSREGAVSQEAQRPSAVVPSCTWDTDGTGARHPLEGLGVKGVQAVLAPLCQNSMLGTGVHSSLLDSQRPLELLLSPRDVPERGPACPQAGLYPLGTAVPWTLPTASTEKPSHGSCDSQGM